MTSRHWWYIVLFTLVLSLLFMAVRDIRGRQWFSGLSGLIKTPSSVFPSTPSPTLSSSSNLGVVDGPKIDSSRMKRQVRGVMSMWSNGGIELSLSEGKKMLIPLKPQIQYACLPSSTERVDKPGVRTKATESYMNLTASDGLGEMMQLEEVRRQIAQGDEVIVVGVASASGEFVGHQVFTLKCQ